MAGTTGTSVAPPPHPTDRRSHGPATPAPRTGRGRTRRSRHSRQLHGGPLVYVILGFATLLSVFPFYWSIVAATRSNADINHVPPPLTPGGNLFSNFGKALDEADIVQALINSTIVSATVAAGTVLCSTLAGFAFAKLRFRGRGILLGITVATMMIPPQLGLIPLFMIMAKLQWVNQLQAVILPTLVTAFGVFFMRQYLLEALPDELIEAGRVDGASYARIFWSIVVPIARPAMAVLGLLTFMTTWNDFFWPIIALSSSNPTVQVAINSLGGGYVHDQSIILAGTLLGTLPVLVVFGLLGRQIVGGIMQGAVKG
ncbi:carbohydrate ABC transporter permease [Embleya sp. NBC_00888]|uniref:carbohydrate ABC transporter permease n=1 Tax=Embleya sp. NBC_00888 TaxID=2975960 RepID=UPI00386FAD34